MILLSNIAFLLGCYFSGAYRKWAQYYNTILYLSLCNFLYNLLCRDYMLWKYQPDVLLNHVTAELVNSFVLLPSVAITYLHFLPASGLRKAYYYLAWVFGFTVLELIWYLTGNITYDNGWNLLYSFIFYIAMFFALELHHKNFKKALTFSVAIVLLLIFVFKVPVWK